MTSAQRGKFPSVTERKRFLYWQSYDPHPPTPPQGIHGIPWLTLWLQWHSRIIPAWMFLVFVARWQSVCGEPTLHLREGFPVKTTHTDALTSRPHSWIWISHKSRFSDEETESQRIPETCVCPLYGAEIVAAESLTYRTVIEEIWCYSKCLLRSLNQLNQQTGQKTTNIWLLSSEWICIHSCIKWSTVMETWHPVLWWRVEFH